MPGSSGPRAGEKASTGIARRFDLIRVEDLQVKSMTRSAKGTAANPGRNVRAKAGLNREILRSGWRLLVRRLEDKASGRVEKVKPGGDGITRPVNREPHLLLPSA